MRDSAVLRVRMERGRSALRVVAQTGEACPAVLVEATFSGGPEGIWLRVTRAGEPSVLLPREVIARHPALSAVLRLIGDEAEMAKPPSEALLAALFSSLLVYVGRMSTPVPLPRWGRPLRDPQIERALGLLNQDISKRWTVELIAKAVGLSRPVFARQFSTMLGLSPMRYLAQKRMQMAASLLLGSNMALAELAASVGYRSEFAFNRAFKRHHGLSPGVYRQQPPRALQLVRLAA